MDLLKAAYDDGLNRGGGGKKKKRRKCCFPSCILHLVLGGHNPNKAKKRGGSGHSVSTSLETSGALGYVEDGGKGGKGEGKKLLSSDYAA